MVATEDRIAFLEQRFGKDWNSPERRARRDEFWAHEQEHAVKHWNEVRKQMKETPKISQEEYEKMREFYEQKRREKYVEVIEAMLKGDMTLVWGPDEIDEEDPEDWRGIVWDDSSRMHNLHPEYDAEMLYEACYPETMEELMTKFITG